MKDIFTHSEKCTRSTPQCVCRVRSLDKKSKTWRSGVNKHGSFNLCTNKHLRITQLFTLWNIHEKNVIEPALVDICIVTLFLKSLFEIDIATEVVAKLVAKPLNLGIIQVYAPTSDGEDVEVDKFYEEVEKAKSYLKSQDIIIVMGDFNAKVGDEGVEDVVGPSGIGTVDEHESRLIEWCKVNDFTITNTWHQNIQGGSGFGRATEIEVETK
ncbi:craniofacial development protein 2-like [Plakobranchus ocellatus]|uniref:Craniofacial development protein 2-like n=1 Tax=Plakobranchus ocellatus TaxID=259542 RepID=A0AAV4C7K8_9GAST|nr:craniofacial development protein 2-like [Plakobranchus ocellatus]